MPHPIACEQHWACIHMASELQLLARCQYALPCRSLDSTSFMSDGGDSSQECLSVLHGLWWWREDWRCAKLPWHAPEYCKRKNPLAVTCLMQNLKKSAASTTVEQAICYHDDSLRKRCFYCWVCCCRFGWDFHGYRDLRCRRTCSAAAHYRCSFEGSTTIWSCQSCFWSTSGSQSQGHHRMCTTPVMWQPECSRTQ